MKLILDIQETGACHVGVGNSFGHAAYDLIEKIRLEYGAEAFDDINLFKAFAGVTDKDDLVYVHSDMSCPEENFTLTLIPE